MGSEGIRRRKPKKRLPKVGRSVGLPGEPPIMWPEAGSGFEANQYSPAGTAQRFWWLTEGLRRGGPRSRRRQRLRLIWLTLLGLTAALVLWSVIAAALR